MVAALIVPMNQMQMPPRAPVQPLGSEASCALNRRSEDVRIPPVVVAELKYREPTFWRGLALGIIFGLLIAYWMARYALG